MLVINKVFRSFRKNQTKRRVYPSIAEAERVFAIVTMTGVSAPSSSFPIRDTKINDRELKEKTEELKRLIYSDL